MKKLITIFLLFFTLTTFVTAEELAPKTSIVDATFKAVLSVDDYVPVGKTVLVDASDSIILDKTKNGAPNYFWEFSNGETKKTGREQTTIFETPGKQKVSLTLVQGQKRELVEKEIFVFKKKALLITDQFSKEEEKAIVTQAAETGTWLKSLSMTELRSSFLSDDYLIKAFSEEKNFIADSNLIIFNTENIDSVSVFVRFIQSAQNEFNFSIADKSIIQLSQGNLNLQHSIINRSRQILGKEEVLLTRPEAINPILEKDNYDDLIGVLDSRAIQYKRINENSNSAAALILTKAVSSFIAEGVPVSTIYLILVFPCIAFLVVFFRQFVGISTYGVYLPIMLALSFFILGIQFGLITILLVFVLSVGIRHIFKHVEMLYIPRVALTLSSIALSFFLILKMALIVKTTLAIPLAVFPMLVITTLSERFVSAQSTEGLKGAMIGIFETILIGLLSFLLTDINLFRDLILAIPELVLIPFVGIILLGKYAGLRITEYFKFRSLFSDGMEE